MPQTYLDPAPTAGGTTLRKRFPPSDIRSTFSDPSGLDPRTIYPHPYNVPRNTPILVPINTQIEPTEAFKKSVKDTIEAIPYFTSSMSYYPKTVLLQLEQLWN